MIYLYLVSVDIKTSSLYVFVRVDLMRRIKKYMYHRKLLCRRFEIIWNAYGIWKLPVFDGQSVSWIVWRVRMTLIKWGLKYEYQTMGNGYKGWMFCVLEKILRVKKINTRMVFQFVSKLVKKKKIFRKGEGFGACVYFRLLKKKKTVDGHLCE